MKKISLEILRHSTSHLMAAAILELFPEAKFGIGPVIANGFYYDFDLEKSLTPQDLQKIEKKMRQLAKKNLKFVKKEMTIDQAIKLFQKLKQPYKIELLKEIKKHGTTEIKKIEKQTKKQKIDKVTIYELGDFVDLCRGPHISSLGQLNAYN